MKLPIVHLRFLVALAGVAVLVATGLVYHQWFFPADPDPQRFARDIGKITQWDDKNEVPGGAIVFVGSSTIKWWDVEAAFPSLPVLNRGFGGSQISDINYYADLLVLQHQPGAVVFHAGENDVHHGKSSRRILRDYRRFVARVQQAQADTPIIFIAIKPSPARRDLWDRMVSVNALIKQYSESSPVLHYVDVVPAILHRSRPPAELFRDDGLHLSEAGYEVFNKEVSAALLDIHHDRQ